MKDEQQPPIWLEVAAAAMVPAACVGFIRVFIEASSVLPIVGAALLSSAVSVLARRLRVPLVVSTAISLTLLTALIINRYAPGTARLGIIPTGQTRAQLSILLDELVSNFRELKSPVPNLAPFVATAMVGAWIMAFLTDWGAMRLRLAFEPVLPAALLFIFSSIPPVNANQHQVLATVIFAGGVAVWAVGQRAANMLQRGVWLANDHKRGPANIGLAGAAVATVAVILGAFVGGRLPGAGADPIYSFAENGDSTRTVVSPFVNIESRLVNQTSRELFTVTSDQPSYWRIAGLDTYEDDIWKVAGDFSPEDGRLPGQSFDDTSSRNEVTQRFDVKALAAIWLPAAFAPTEIVDSTAEVTWNAEHSSLTVANDIPSSDGVQYSLLSSVPAYNVDELRASPDVVPSGDIANRYLGLPSDLTPQVAAMAAEVTADQTTRYDKMLALQTHFRAFDYNVRLGPREGDPIEQFLREREGFCQQFSGTFALMARSLGIPARVATGFTWGDPAGTDPETGNAIYSVTGRHTHAWPEVYFEDIGWVAFEPTPGRGLPAAEYTGLDAEQDSLVQPDNPGGPTTTTTVDASNTPVTPQPQNSNGFEEPDVIDPIDTDAGGIGFSIPWRLVAVVLLIGAYVGGVPALLHLRRLSRRNRATTPSARVEAAWAEAAEALELGFELERVPSETRMEFADRLGADRRVPAEEINGLAEVATVARFYPNGVTDLAADHADDLAETVEAEVKSRVPLHTRWLRTLDPRRLFRPTTRITDSGQRPLDDRLPGRDDELVELDQ